MGGWCFLLSEPSKNDKYPTREKKRNPGRRVRKIGLVVSWRSLESRARFLVLTAVLLSRSSTGELECYRARTQHQLESWLAEFSALQRQQARETGSRCLPLARTRFFSHPPTPLETIIKVLC